MKIKICGLTCPQDMEAVNAARPDYCGFVIRVPGSRRSLEPSEALRLRGLLAQDILPVGVFVREEPETVVSLLQAGAIDAVQLHGNEEEAYLDRLRERMLKRCGRQFMLIKAFSASVPGAAAVAAATGADYPLFDNGKGGTGQSFDWSALQPASRPFFLAGGLQPGNLRQAAEALHPYAVDLSSGVETDGKKDAGKVLAAVEEIRRF